MKSVKGHIRFMMLLGMVLVSSISFLYANALVQINPNQLNTPLTNPFTVQIVVSNVNNLYAFAVDVLFDPSMLRMDSVSQGAALSGGGSFNTFFFHNIDNSNGLAIIGITRSVATGIDISAPQAVVSIAFTPLNSGTTQVQLANVGLLAPDGHTDYPADIVNGQIMIVGSNPGINLFFDPVNCQAEIPEFFTIDLKLNHIDDLFGFAGDVIFDPEVTTLEEVIEGSFLNDNESVPTIFMADINNRTGVCILGITRFATPPTGVSTNTPVTLVTLKFRSQRPGTSPLCLVNTGLIAPNGIINYDHEVNNGSISVSIDVGHSNLSFSPPNAELQEHDLVSSSIVIDRVTDLYGFAAVVNFDPEKLEAIELIERSFLNANGTVPTSFVYNIDNDLGTITVGLSRLGTVSGASTYNPATLLTVFFRALTAGTDEVYLNNIGLIASDAATMYPCIASIMSVEISASTTDSATVSNVQATQRADGTMLVDIFYDLIHPTNDQSSIGILASNNNGLSWDYSCNLFLAGSDVGGGIYPGLAKHIVWDIATEHPGIGQELLIKVIVMGTDAYAVSAPFPVNTSGAQSGSYILGSVKNRNNMPLSDVALIITGMAYSQQSQTNTNGQFTVGNIGVNQVNIIASKVGYNTETLSIMISPGANYVTLILSEEVTQIASVVLSPSLTIYADSIIESPINFFTFSGNININGIIRFTEDVRIDKRPYLTHPVLTMQGEVRGMDIMGQEPVIIHDLAIPILYTIVDDQLVPYGISSIVEATDLICGFEFEIGRLKISEAQNLGKYVEVMALIKTEESNFFRKIMDWRSRTNHATPPIYYMPDLEQLSFSKYYSRNLGIEFGGEINGLSMNFGVFRIDNLSVWIDQVNDIFGGSLKLKIPGVGSLRNVDDFDTVGLELPVTIGDLDTGRLFSTDLGQLIDMYDRGIFHHLEIEALLEFAHGSLNSLAISLGGMDIPIFATGTFIREIHGGVHDLAVNDLRIEASVDIGLHSDLDVPLMGPVVYLNDMAVTVKPWSYVRGGGEFQVFKQTVSNGKIFYDAEIQSLGLEANMMLMMEMNDPGSSILNGKVYGNINTDQFNAGLNAQLKTPDDLPWFLNWAEGITLASAEVSIHNFELSTMLQLYNMSFAQKLVYGKPTFPYFHYYLGSNYNNMYQLWKGSRNGMQTIDFQVPENARQILIVAGNDSNLFDFTIASPSHEVYDNSHTGYQQFASTNQSIMVIDYPKPGNWSFSTAQQGLIRTDFKVIDQPPSALVSMPATRGSRDNTIRLSLTDYSDTLNVKVYYNSDNRHFNGVFIQEFNVLNNAELEFVWHNNHLDNGEYYIYTRIDDGKNPPVLQYAPGSIIVNNYNVPAPQNVHATMSHGELIVTWDNPASGNIILTEILVEDVYNKSRTSYSVMDVDHYVITDLINGREYEVLCRFANSLYQKSDYCSAGTIVFGYETRNVPPYFTMDKDEVWWFVENQPQSYTLTAANPDGGSVRFLLSDSQDGMGIRGNSFFWTPISQQKGFYLQPLVVTNGEMTDTLYQQIIVYSEQQAEVKVSFSSHNLYEADRMFIKINNLYSDEPFQIVTLTNLSSDSQVDVNCRRVNKFEYIGQFSLSVLNRSELTVSDGDAIEVSYAFGGNIYHAISTYSSEPQASDNVAPAAVTDLEAIDIGMDNIKLRWTASGDNSHSGRAYRYDLRYSYQPIQSSDNFLVSNLYPINLYPSVSGMIDSLTISIQDLPSIHQYDMIYFALVIEDANQNRSNLSNCVSHAYFASPDSIEISLINDASVEITWSEITLPRKSSSLDTANHFFREEVAFVGYQLWREHDGNASLLADSLSMTSFTDSIISITDGSLRYGVKAVYANGVSDLRLSNTLQLNRFIDVRILCQQDGLSPANNVQYSIVGLDSLYQHSFSGQTHLSGVILLDDVYQGIYRLFLDKTGCFPAVHILDLSNSGPDIVFDIYSALAPEQVFIDLVDNQVSLSWIPVRGASYYRIYASEEPDSPGSLISIQSDIGIQLPMQGDRLFFWVVAGCD